MITDTKAAIGQKVKKKWSAPIAGWNCCPQLFDIKKKCCTCYENVYELYHPIRYVVDSVLWSYWTSTFPLKYQNIGRLVG